VPERYARRSQLVDIRAYSIRYETGSFCFAAKTAMLIVTNFARFPQSWQAANGLDGRTALAYQPLEFWRERGNRTVWLVNCDTTLTLKLGGVKLASPRAAVLIAADLVLRTPLGRDRLSLPLKRLLLRQVDHFIHYFRDVSGLDRTFGIGADRSSFVPFKVNLVDRFTVDPAPEGQYVLCLGRSMRDFDTFLDAIEQLPYPAAITTPDQTLFAKHGTRFTRPLDALPKNVRVLEDNGSDEAMIGIVKGARLVVLPILATSMVASGISTALNAMILGKCVIGSEGPGMSDIFTNEVLTAPPEDAWALAQVIQRAWEDDELRSCTAAAGLRYAREAGGEPDLYQRVIDQVAVWFSSHG
jgi:glycosyltransferase involved in cell wall biosynthesis